MHEAFCEDPAIGESDVHYMADPANTERTRKILLHRDPSLPGRQFPWGVIPEDRDASRVLKLCLMNDDKAVVELPDVIRRLPNLRWLEIPRRFVPGLEAGAIPPSTRTLRITGGGSAALPRGLVLHGLVRIDSDREGMLKFTPGQIPDVRNLAVKLDPGRSLLRLIAGMSGLEALEIGPISDREVLDALADLPLRYLRAVAGNVDSVEPLRALGSLTNLRLEGLNQLTSIAPLADLPQLRELSITYCGRLALDRSILRMPALRKLMFFACKDIGLTPIRTEIEGLGLEHFVSSGTQ